MRSVRKRGAARLSGPVPREQGTRRTPPSVEYGESLRPVPARRAVNQAVALATLLAAMACGGPEPEAGAAPCAYQVYGACIELAAAVDGATEERVKANLDHALAYWGVTPSVLEGWRVQYAADGGCGLEGCEYGGLRVVRLRVRHASCFEENALGHELGHVLGFGEPVPGNEEDEKMDASLVSVCRSSVLDAGSSPGCRLITNLCWGSLGEPD